MPLPPDSAPDDDASLLPMHEEAPAFIEAEAESEIPCPFCLRDIPKAAYKCCHCGANVRDMKLCQHCQEPVRSAATTCPFCRSDLRPPQAPRPALLAEPWIVYAHPIGAAIGDQSFTALFFPPEMTITDSEIRIVRKSFLGLRTVEQKISVERVASVRAQTGVVWAAIAVETYGGATGVLVINGLDKDEAARTGALIEKLAHLSPKA